jgi:nucleoside-diphosphate-sugar epimerase
MNVLLLGGTGLISTGIVKHLLKRNAKLTLFNRGQRENRLPQGIETIRGDRNEFESFEREMKSRKFDAVIDMICFNARQAESACRAFGGRCGHYIFCSTVCTYGSQIPSNVLIDETFPQNPISQYGRDKLACEDVFLRAHDARQFNTTIIRPSHTYGAGHWLIDNLEFNPTSWDCIQQNLPVLCAGDGLGLWVSTHRDDCGKLFAYAAMNDKTYGQCYNATRDRIFTWRDYYREAGAALGKKPQVIFMPAAWIIGHDAARFGLLREITQFHGAYTSEKARRDVPEFHCEIEFTRGAAETFADVRRRNAWKNNSDDALYQSMVDQAVSMGVEPVEA